MKKKFIKYLVATGIFFGLSWVVLTLYVEQEGPPKLWLLGDASQKNALIVFDADPFYNLDEQVCMSFGEALATQNFRVTIATVATADSISTSRYDLVVYCANTYNWRPDWAVTSFIEDHSPSGNNVPTVAITLGAGSTEASQRNLEHAIASTGAKLINSYSLWLWRPNDERKMETPNVDIAVDMAHEWGLDVAAAIYK